MHRILFAALATVFAIAACGTGPNQSANLPSHDELLAEMSQQNGRACIRSADIQGFAPLSDNVVSVSARSRGHYLVTTLFRCPSLTSSINVGFAGNFAEVCGGSGRIVSREESCPIRGIYRFADRDDALASWEMIKARREVMAQFPASPPEDP